MVVLLLLLLRVRHEALDVAALIDVIFVINALVIVSIAGRGFVVNELRCAPACAHGSRARARVLVC